MKSIPIFLGALALVFNAAGAEPSQDESVETLSARLARETPPPLEEYKPNTITVGPISYSGIAVQMVKTDNLLQLFNPFAPGSYGHPEDNVVRDPINGKVSGLKIFSVQF